VRQPDLALPELAAPPAVRLLRLRHGGLPWAVAGDSVCEVVGTERLQRNPRPTAASPYGWLLGEREEIPVFLPAERGAAGGAAAAVVVLQPAGGPRCGLGVEAVDEMRREPVARLRLLPVAAAGRRWAFPRVVFWDDGLALEIAPEAVPHLAATAAPGAALPAATAAPPAAGQPRLDAALPPASSSAGSSGLFVFALPAGGALGFALPAVQVVEVLAAVVPRPVPGAPETLLGLLAWRGEALPVIDLAREVGLPPASPAGSPRDAGFAHGLVARAAHSRQLLVFPVERMTGVRQGPFPQPVTAIPPFPGARRILGAFSDGERVLVVPDLDGALQTSPAAPAATDAAAGGR
jgi:chemotaxis signal transduction protein